MKDVSIIGVDLAKQVFQLHGATVEVILPPFEGVYEIV